mgnify:CR=1 FL=1
MEEHTATYPFGLILDGVPGTLYRACWAHAPNSLADFRFELDPDAELAAIVQRSEQPTAADFLKVTLLSKTELGTKDKVPIFSSCEEMIADEDVMSNTDGVIICTAHACHSWMAKLYLEKGVHVLCEVIAPESPGSIDLQHTRCSRHSEKSAQMQWRVRALCEPRPLTTSDPSWHCARR